MRPGLCLSEHLPRVGAPGAAAAPAPARSVLSPPGLRDGPWVRMFGLPANPWLSYVETALGKTEGNKHMSGRNHQLNRDLSLGLEVLNLNMLNTVLGGHGSVWLNRYVSAT